MNTINNQLRPTSCLLCDSDPAKIFRRFSKSGYAIYQCMNCGGLFVYPQISETELLSIYGEDYFRRGNKYTFESANQYSDSTQKNDSQKIAYLQRYQPTGRLLDVGCATGGFLKIAQEAGYEIAGVEVSEYAVSAAREHLAADIFHGDVLSAHFPAKAFDIVTLWDVLEHLRDPHVTLQEIVRILRPEGILCLSTGDASSFIAKALGKYWHLLTPPQHVFFYTPNSLRKILEQHGLTQQALCYMGKKTTLDFVLFKARETFGPAVEPLRVMCNMLKLQHVSVTVNLHDIMTVIARKE